MPASYIWAEISKPDLRPYIEVEYVLSNTPEGLYKNKLYITDVLKSNKDRDLITTFSLKGFGYAIKCRGCIAGATIQLKLKLWI